MLQKIITIKLLRHYIKSIPFHRLQIDQKIKKWTGKSCHQTNKKIHQNCKVLFPYFSSNNMVSVKLMYRLLIEDFLLQMFLLLPSNQSDMKDFDFTLLTSKNRKGAFQQMVKKYLKAMHTSNQSKTNIIMDPFFILVALLLGQESEIYNQLLTEVSNVNEATIFSKQDLEFYIPQLCTYLVFHEQMSNIQLTTFLQRACKIDLHFSLRYYFFMKSLEMIDTTYEIKKVPIVEKYNLAFRNKINLCHKIKQSHANFRKSLQLSKSQSFSTEQKDDQDSSVSKFSGKENIVQTNNLQKQKKYRKDSFMSETYSEEHDEDFEQGTNDFDIYKTYNIKDTPFTQIQKPTTIQIKQIYTPCVGKFEGHYPLGLFESTANFFFDLVQISELLLKVEGDASKIFQHNLIEMNSKLPSVVYIPLTKSDYQGLNILKIVVKECRVFRTKQRAPFKVCFETFYNPNTSDHSSREKKIRSTLNSTKSLKRSVLFEQDIQLKVEGQNTLHESKVSNDIMESRVSNGSKEQRNPHDVEESATELENKKKINFKEIKKNIWGKLFRLKKLIKDDEHPRVSKSPPSKQGKVLNSSIDKNAKMEEDSMAQNQSTFTDSQSHKEDKQRKAMVINQEKNYDGKQSQIMTEYQAQNQDNDPQCEIFGSSQSSRFDVIANNSPYSKLPGYKIVSFMIKSNDDLRQECFAMQLLYEFLRIFQMEKLKINLCPYEVMPLSHNSGVIQFIPEAVTIDQLMKKHGNLSFVRKSHQKLKNFVRSLAGYSLVTYMLQVKDRHNQNIMIKRDGTLVHIDFGFFLSNMPGKGVELQKKVPFKLTYEYIDALGGVDSKEFAYFRKLFYKGFNALRKHQHRILILTKLMYSSYGTTMKCFEKGDEAIQKLVKRFNPKNVRTDGQLSLFCQHLVNESIGNWRAKWYDRWQYFAQGIVY